MKSATRSPSALYCFTLSQAAADGLSACGSDQARMVLRGLEKAWSANGVFVTDRGREHWKELVRVAGLPGEGTKRLLLHFLEAGPVAELAAWPQCADVAAASREVVEPEGGTWFVSEEEYDRMDLKEEQELLAESRCNDKDVEFCRLMTFSDTRWDSGHASLDLEADASWTPFVSSLLPMVLPLSLTPLKFPQAVVTIFSMPNQTSSILPWQQASETTQSESVALRMAPPSTSAAATTPFT
jgi:hypothetical protein